MNFIYQIANPQSMKPPFRFGTIANGVNLKFIENKMNIFFLFQSTDEVVKTNHKETYAYMKQFMKKNISEGIKALKME